MPVPVLFLGNSYTEVNALDQVVSALLREGAPGYEEVEATRLSAGGLRWEDHVARTQTDARWEEALLTGDSAWRWGVLQEQSQIPGFYGEDPSWEQSANAGAELDAMLQAKGAETWLLLTWGRRDGDSTNPSLYPDFPTMQDQLTEGYLAYQERLSTSERPVWVAPAGLAFLSIWDEAEALGELPADGLFGRLYAEDGSHPSMAGTYLVACVLYSSLTGLSPEGLSAPGGVPADDVLTLQRTAAKVVLEGGWTYPWSVTGGDSGEDSPTDSPADSPTDSPADSPGDSETPVAGPDCGCNSARGGVFGLWTTLLALALGRRASAPSPG